MIVQRPMSAVPDPALWAAITDAASAAGHYRNPGITTRAVARRLTIPGAAVDLAEIEERLSGLYRAGLLARLMGAGVSRWRFTSAGAAHAAELRGRELTDAEAWPAVSTHLADRALLGGHPDGLSPAALARALAVDTGQVLAWLAAQARLGLVEGRTAHDRPAWLITPAGRAVAVRAGELVCA
ncbi:hypothetical protein [Parafrankia sp. EUN1f]|uniref:hypothetical protein n=1 Tax=Parafrankia sp. EUN1f TaxID=102897 RepID=UPI001E422BFA|nr:hypothetical protein [Parafrankia sp. EUN1f]